MPRLFLAILLAAGMTLAADKPVTDDVIVDQVRVKLANDHIVIGGAIEVESKGGVVTLSGSVPYEKRKDRAAKLAKQVKGVKEVVNNLVVQKTPVQ